MNKLNETLTEAIKKEEQTSGKRHDRLVKYSIFGIL